MSDSKRNKKYSKLKQETKRPIILAKKDGKNEKNNFKLPEEQQTQPKILLKSKEKEQTPQISIAVRENAESSSSQSPNTVVLQTKERDQPAAPTVTTIEQPIIPVPIMTRPITLISTTNSQLNSNCTKVLVKSNTDFFVVGVLGCQGVGKSTILNLLALDDSEIDIYNTIFKKKEGVFPTKFKGGKTTSLPHTESVQMFITKDRIILLDFPPVLSNFHKRDATTNELEDIKTIIMLLTVCHLLIVVQDDFFSINLMRLLQFAELTKPNQDSKPFINDYFPNALFIKNKAKRIDFLPGEKERTETILGHFFKDSQLKICLGQTDKHNKRGKQIDQVKGVNYFIFPEVKGGFLTSYHPSLEILVADLRNRVFMSPRLQMYNGNTELTEAIWFELVGNTSISKNHFFLTTYEEIRRCHTHSGVEQSGKNNLNFADGVD